MRAKEVDSDFSDDEDKRDQVGVFSGLSSSKELDDSSIEGTESENQINYSHHDQDADHQMLQFENIEQLNLRDLAEQNYDPNPFYEFDIDDDSDGVYIEEDDADADADADIKADMSGSEEEDDEDHNVNRNDSKLIDDDEGELGSSVILHNGNESSDSNQVGFQYHFNENLVWVISEFLPQEDVCTRMIYVSKLWNRALKRFPLILDQSAVKSLLGKRAIRLAHHHTAISRMLQRWSIGYLCIRLKSRDTLTQFFSEFPELEHSLWGIVVKTKNKNRWTPFSSDDGTNIPNRECVTISRCKILEVLDIRCCGGLQDLSSILRNCTNTLRRLDLSGCNELTDASILALCHNLESLCLDNCENLVEIPDLIWCPNLQTFLLGQCERLEALPDLSRCASLRRIHLGNCSSLHDVSTLCECTELREISMTRYEALTDLSSFSQFRNLVTLDLAYCKNLRRVTGLAECIHLQYVSFDYCAKLRDISALRFCPKLHTLSLTYCKQIRDISSLVGCKGPNCGRLHTVDANELEYFARLERAQGIRPMSADSNINFSGWRLWVRLGLFGDSLDREVANGVLFTIPGMGKYIPPIQDRLQLHYFPLVCNATASSLECVEIRKCRKVKMVESLVACVNLKRLSVHSSGDFPDVDIDEPHACHHFLRRQVNHRWWPSWWT